MFYFHPETWGRMFTHVDIHMLQMGWGTNHQLSERHCAILFRVPSLPFFQTKPIHFSTKPTGHPQTRQQDTLDPRRGPRTTRAPTDRMAPLSVEELERAVQNALEAKAVRGGGNKNFQLGEGWG